MGFRYTVMSSGRLPAGDLLGAERHHHDRDVARQRVVAQAADHLKPSIPGIRRSAMSRSGGSRSTSNCSRVETAIHQVMSSGRLQVRKVRRCSQQLVVPTTNAHCGHLHRCAPGWERRARKKGVDRILADAAVAACSLLQPYRAPLSTIAAPPERQSELTRRLEPMLMNSGVVSDFPAMDVCDSRERLKYQKHVSRGATTAGISPTDASISVHSRNERRSFCSGSLPAMRTQRAVADPAADFRIPEHDH